jgi:probable HAF family extracellular repeat protein
MQSPSNHIRALVKSIVTVGLLSVVCFTASAATGLAGGIAAQASTQTYSITDLGTLGGFSTTAYGINGNGQIVGKSLVKLTSGKTYHYTYHAFLYSAGTMTDLGTLGGDDSEARAINKYGDVVGFSNLCAGCSPYHAFLYHNGHMTDLGTLGGSCSNAYGMNDLGEVVGEACTTTSQVAFLYSGGTMTDLGGPYSGASGINNSHQVVGGSGSHAVLWSNGTMTDLGTLGGSYSAAYAINNVGQIVGDASPPKSSVHAFLYSGGKMKDLGVFYDSSVAEAINTFGVVVGESDNHAFLYTGGKLQDLNTLIPSGSGWLLTEATGINDTGQIVCNAINTNGYTHALLLNPI